jgi:hypothetical protein
MGSSGKRAAKVVTSKTTTSRSLVRAVIIVFLLQPVQPLNAANFINLSWREVGGKRYAVASVDSFPFRFTIKESDNLSGLIIPLNGKVGTIYISNETQRLKADGKKVVYIADARSEGVPAVLVESPPVGTFTVDLRDDIVVTEASPFIFIDTDKLFAKVCTEGYVSGICAKSFFDKRTGARDVGFGLDIVDWLMQSNAEAQAVDATPYRPPYDETYRFAKIANRVPKPYIELPQICTVAKKLPYEIIHGDGFVAIHQWWNYTQSNPGFNTGSRWDQWLVFAPGLRYFFCSDTVRSENSLGSLILRIDMPGHLKHEGGDTFSKIWLSYAGYLEKDAFSSDFPPEARNHYKRGVQPLPERVIRAYQLKAPSGAKPWLAGLTLAPETVSESWCHQYGYVCFIQEIGRVPVSRGDHFSSVNIVGYFDSPEEMIQVYDLYKGYRSVAATREGFVLSKDVALAEGSALQTKPWGLSPDSLTEGDWNGGSHFPWVLGNVVESGIDRIHKMAGYNSLYLVAQPGPEGEKSYAEWGDYNDFRNKTPAKADYERTVNGIHDVKDLQLYRALNFAMKLERPVPSSQFRVLLYSVNREDWIEYDFDPPADQLWKEISIDLDKPTRSHGRLDRQYTGSVRLLFDVRSKSKIWLDNFRLEVSRPGAKTPGHLR